MGDLPPELGLDRRAGLPDALRVLLAEYPREGWEVHPNFTALTAFWLDRHLGFRRMQGLLLDETRAFIGGDREPLAYAGGLVRLAGRFLNELHGHHSIEDHHYFPALEALDARLSTGFTLLDADHHAIDPLLHAMAERANALLAAIRDGAPTADPAGRLEADLARFAGFLDRHLTDEEEIVVPVILANPGRAPG
jgi:hypothetical protein